MIERASRIQTFGHTPVESNFCVAEHDLNTLAHGATTFQLRRQELSLGHHQQNKPRQSTVTRLLQRGSESVLNCRADKAQRLSSSSGRVFSSFNSYLITITFCVCVRVLYTVFLAANLQVLNVQRIFGVITAMNTMQRTAASALMYLRSAGCIYCTECYI